MESTFNDKLLKLRADIASSTTYKEKLDIWADTAANICHDIATSSINSIKVDRFFYAFQSPPLDHRPKLLIIAFNPKDKDETTYDAGCKNESRNYERVTGDELKKANMSWGNTWRIWQNLKKSFVSTELNGLLDSFVYMNMVYFGSDTVESLYKKNKGAKMAEQICTELTHILAFEIFKPDYILCLGENSFLGISNSPLFAPSNLIHITEKVKSKEANQILIVGIPHASGARGITDELRVEIGEAIHKAFFKNAVDSTNRVYTLNTKFDKSTLNKIMELVRSNDTLSKLTITEGNENGGNIRYDVDGFDNEKLEITITITSNGYIGVRNAKTEGRNINQSQIDSSRYSKILEKLGFRDSKKGGNWIGIKPFSQYNTIEAKEITRNIESDITEILACLH